MHGARTDTIAGGGGMRAALMAVWAVVLAASIIQTANGLQTDLLGVRAGLATFPPWSVGVMMAGYYAGFSLGPILSPFVVRTLGHTRAITFGAIVAGAIIIAHGLVVTPLVWTGLRAFDGFFLSTSYVAIESFINDRVGATSRGRVLSVYMVLQMVGMTFAQGLFLLADPATLIPFLLCAALFLFSAAPLRFVPAGHDAALPRPFGLIRLFRLSPLGTAATLLAGMSWSVLFTFGPVYAQRKGFSLNGIGLFMSLAMVSGALVQFPLGWLSDHFGRRRAVVLLCACATLAAGLGALFDRMPARLEYIAMALTGAFVFPLYALAAARTNDFVEPENRVAASAGLILLFGLGSIAGPLAAGSLMSLMGPQGFFIVLAATMAAGLAFAAMAR
ncbi:MAG: MFS transporter [Rhizomicrobium sp.]